MDQLFEVHVVGLIMDPVSKSPVMILKPLNDKKVIPIWIGMPEANSIALELESICSPRPMTHDLIKAIMYHLQGEVQKVIISDIIENTFYAELHIRHQEETAIIDCRPSDAVALALKQHAKIFVTEQVMGTSIMSDVFSHYLDDEDKIDRWFNSLTAEDFGNVEQ
jgi:uncharacterized protein